MMQKPDGAEQSIRALNSMIEDLNQQLDRLMLEEGQYEKSKILYREISFLKSLKAKLLATDGQPNA